MTRWKSVEALTNAQPASIKAALDAPAVVLRCAQSVIEAAPYSRPFRYNAPLGSNTGYMLTAEDVWKYAEAVFACVRAQGIPVSKPPRDFPSEKWLSDATMRTFILWAASQVASGLRKVK